jgi:hypothetical protein
MLIKQKKRRGLNVSIATLGNKSNKKRGETFGHIATVKK